MIEGPEKQPHINIPPIERSSLDRESRARELYLRCKTIAERQTTPVEIEIGGKLLYKIKMTGYKGTNPTIELTRGDAYDAVFTIDSFGKILKKEQPNSGVTDPVHSVELRTEEIRDIVQKLNEVRLGEIFEKGEASINDEIRPEERKEESDKELGKQK